MNIKEVEKQIGLSSRNIRFYEEEGLLQISRNATNGYREFDDASIQKLKEIKMLRDLGVSLDAIRKYQQQLLSLKEVMDLRLQELKEENETVSVMQAICEQIKQSDATLTPYMIDACKEKIQKKETKPSLPSMGKHQMKIRVFWICFPFALILFMLFQYAIFPMLFWALEQLHIITVETVTLCTNNGITFIISLLLGIFSGFLLNLFYGLHRQTFFEMQETGFYYIEKEDSRSILSVAFAFLLKKTNTIYHYLSFEDIYKVEPGLRVVGATSYTASKIYELVFRIETKQDESIVFACGMMGQEQKGINLLVDTLKQYAEVITDPYHLMEMQNLNPDEYYQHLEKVFSHRIKANAKHHRYDSLWD